MNRAVSIFLCVFFITISSNMLHEGLHYVTRIHYGIEPSEICFIGLNRVGSEEIVNYAAGWVTYPASESYKNWHHSREYEETVVLVAQFLYVIIMTYVFGKKLQDHPPGLYVS